MSENIQSGGSFEDKMQGITSYLKTKVIDPAEQEKAQILSGAEEEKKKIIEAAKAEAEKIVADAKAEAARQESTLQSALRIAGKQAVDTLKLSLEKEVLKKGVAEPTAAVLGSEEIVKEFLKEVISIFLEKGGENASLVLSGELKSKLSDYVKNEIVSKAEAKMALSDDTVPNGFSVVLKDKNLMFDFSQESMVELLSDFLRPELRTYLFEK